MVWTGFIRLRIERMAGYCEYDKEYMVFIKREYYFSNSATLSYSTASELVLLTLKLHHGMRMRVSLHGQNGFIYTGTNILQLCNWLQKVKVILWQYKSMQGDRTCIQLLHKTSELYGH
jgi:hypothetical protein